MISSGKFIPTDEDMHWLHKYNLRYYKYWTNLTGWHTIDFDAAKDYIAEFNDLKEMNT